MASNTSTANVSDTANEGENTAPPTLKKRRGSNFTKQEDLIICRAFITTSEDATVGVVQKSKDFKIKMLSNYEKLLGEAETSFDDRTYESIYKRYKQVASKVMKFLATENITTCESGWNDQKFHDQCVKVFKQRYPKLGDPNEFALCLDYLRDKPKFHTWVANSIVEAEEKKAGEKTTMEQRHHLLSPELTDCAIAFFKSMSDRNYFEMMTEEQKTDLRKRRYQADAAEADLRTKRYQVEAAELDLKLKRLRNKAAADENANPNVDI